MKYNQIQSVKELLVIIMNQCAVIALAITIMGLNTNNNTYLPVWIVMIIVPIILQILRNKVSSFFLFFGLHLFFPLIIILLPINILLKGVMMIVMMVYIITSIYIRIKKKSQEIGLYPPMFVFAVLGIVTIFENQISKNGWEKYYIILAFTYLFVYFIHYFVNRYHIFIEANKGSAANIPKREIFKEGLKQTLMFTVGSLLLLLITLNIEWLRYLSNLVLKVIRILVRLLLANKTVEDAEDYDVLQNMQNDPDLSGMPDVNTEPALIWLILEKIMIVLLIGIAVSAVVIGLVKGFRYLWDNFHAAKMGKEIEAELEKDVREKCAIESNAKEVVRWMPFLNNRQKIRKIFQKQILKNKTTIVGNHNVEELEYLTAKECCDKLMAEKMKTVYEKARYTEEEITSEDVKTMKAVLK